MHTSHPPFLFIHSCEMIVYPTCFACDVIKSQSIVLLIQVSVMKPMSMFSNSMWCRNNVQVVYDRLYVSQQESCVFFFSNIIYCVWVMI